MPGNARQIITEAERRFPVRVRIAVPSTGVGERLNRLHAWHAWLDENCGVDSWEITPSGMPGVVNDAIAVYFREPASAAAFAARWCAPVASGITEGVLRIRDDEPAQRVPTRPPKRPQDRF